MRGLTAEIQKSTACEGTAKVLHKFANARDQMLTFALAPSGTVELMNNGCERDLRSSVSGRTIKNGFRSLSAAEVDAAVRTNVSIERIRSMSNYKAIRETI